MSQHPYEKLVEAFRRDNGWYYSDDFWECVVHKCGAKGQYDVPELRCHEAHCPVRLALEAAPPPMPKLTPLPPYPFTEQEAWDWLFDNRKSIIAQQENTVEQPAETAFKLQERSLESKVNWLIEKVGLLMAYKVMEPPTAQQPEPVTRGELNCLRNDVNNHRVLALESLQKVYQRLDALEARQLRSIPMPEDWKLNVTRQPQTPEPKPKCERCGDTKLVRKTKQLHFNHSVTDITLCPCVKVGDVVSAEVYDLLPVDSRVTQVPTIDEFEYYWERRDAGWFVVDPNHDKPMNMERRERRILRIGPAPATDDAVLESR